MDKSQIRGVLDRLHEELADAQDVDEDLLERLRALQHDIDRVLQADHNVEGERLLERAQALELRFAAEHPRAEGVLREIMAALGRMGI